MKAKCKTCILLLLSLTNAVCLFMFLKWVEKNNCSLRKSEHSSLSSLLKLWRWEHGRLVTEHPGACGLSSSCSPLTMAPGSGADPKVWQSSAASLLLAASYPRGSRLLDHRSPASCKQEQRIGEAAVELQMYGFSSGKPETIMWVSELAHYIQQILWDGL